MFRVERFLNREPGFLEALVVAVLCLIFVMWMRG
jgi:hypothetical protein